MSKKLIARIIVSLLLFYAVLGVGAVLFQNKLLYYPTAVWRMQPPQPMQVVRYKTEDGLELHGWFSPPRRGKPIIVMFHGNSGNLSYHKRRRAYFIERGYGLMLAEYRGYGGNPGFPSEEGLYRDARAAIKWVTTTQKVKTADLIIYGHSLGAAIASEMAAEFPDARALVLEAPFSSLESVAAATYPVLYPFCSFIAEKYNNIEKAKDFRMPLLVINGDADDIIPCIEGQRLFDAAGSKHKALITLKGGNHSDLINFGSLPEIEKFLKGVLKK